jgi:hypothetical protein
MNERILAVARVVRHFRKFATPSTEKHSSPDCLVESGAIPATDQGLVEFEKLFDMPALRIMNSQILDFVTGDGGQEGFEIIILAIASLSCTTGKSTSA